jgi:D-hydroxyproline dehydrogenase subunit beta
MARLTDKRYDLVVVGAGIVGLATAWAARQRGLGVAVVERHAQAVGASVRNFGLVTCTGQRRGRHWERARQTLDIWRQLAPQAGIEIAHEGMYVLAQRTEAVALMEAFLQTDMGDGCRFLSRSEIAHEAPVLQSGQTVLYSPHEIRVESREAIPRLTRWLEQAMGVDFYWNATVVGIGLPQVGTSRGELDAQHCIVCSGNELSTLYPEWIEQAGVRQCTLQMMRVMPGDPVKLPGAVLSDLSLVRYEGYADLPEALALKARVLAEQPEYLQQGVHLIAVQSRDGSLVVGDSHVYGATEAPFASSEVEDLILSELHRVLRLPGARVTERWTGGYASASDEVFISRPLPGVVLGLVTGGTGASTSFALGQELVERVLAG